MDYPICRYPEISQLSTRDAFEIMGLFPEQQMNPLQEAEVLLQDVFVHGIANRAGDIHITQRGTHDQARVQFSIRTSHHFINFDYAGPTPKKIRDKLLQLCNISSGANTAPVIDTRFSIRLPHNFALSLGLQPIPGQPYKVNVRVGYIQTFDGLSFTCRLLDQQRAPKLQDFGMSHALYRALHQAIRSKSGMILVSGPTGSGKTTLLNACIQEINDGQRKIFTIEDPVEYELSGAANVVQVQVGGTVTHPAALRASLRHNINVLLIGEIRDPESMEIALQAAQTGHLVLATIHADQGIDTVSRALDLTIDKQRDAYRLAQTLKFVAAIRLLDRHEGQVVQRARLFEEKDWMDTNGLPACDTVPEIRQARRLHDAKVSIIEGFCVDYQIRRDLLNPHISSETLYQHASQQLIYESLPMAGMRAVESRNVLLSDCQTALCGVLADRSYQPLRTRLATEHDLSLTQVNELIDEFVRYRDQEPSAQLDTFIASMAATESWLATNTRLIAERRAE